ncbi:hypothetical protein ACPPTR_01190, partial [Ralstonia pseudosolanacearum]|uniref:hypothetical protein n=1 Tax=Ralstonia pseudosolanacearum TaxID=1310165 RepID=UPI003C79BC60
TALWLASYLAALLAIAISAGTVLVRQSRHKKSLAALAGREFLSDAQICRQFCATDDCGVPL